MVNRVPYGAPQGFVGDAIPWGGKPANAHPSYRPAGVSLITEVPYQDRSRNCIGVTNKGKSCDGHHTPNTDYCPAHARIMGEGIANALIGWFYYGDASGD